jgi:hypothetical protein
VKLRAIIKLRATMKARATMKLRATVEHRATVELRATVKLRAVEWSEGLVNPAVVQGRADIPFVCDGKLTCPSRFLQS